MDKKSKPNPYPSPIDTTSYKTVAHQSPRRGTVNSQLRMAEESRGASTLEQPSTESQRPSARAQETQQTPRTGRSQQRPRKSATLDRAAEPAPVHQTCRAPKAKAAFSRAVRLTNDQDQMDAEVQLRKLQKNKIHHLHFNPTYCTKEWRQHYQELFDRSHVDVDIQDQFVEKLQVEKRKIGKVRQQPSGGNMSKVLHPDDIKSAADAKAYARVIKPRKVFWNFHARVQSPEGAGGLTRPRQMIKEGKEYILAHYHRTFGDKMESQGVREPDYVSDFRYKEEVDVQAKLRALKKFGYDNKWEDKQLKSIQKALLVKLHTNVRPSKELKYGFINTDGAEKLVVVAEPAEQLMPSDKVAKRLNGFGMMSLRDVTTHEAMPEVEEEHSYHSSCSDLDKDDLNVGFAPKKSPKSVQLRQKFERLRTQAQLRPPTVTRPKPSKESPQASEHQNKPVKAVSTNWRDRYRNRHNKSKETERRVTFNNPKVQKAPNIASTEDSQLKNIPSSGRMHDALDQTIDFSAPLPGGNESPFRRTTIDENSENAEQEAELTNIQLEDCKFDKPSTSKRAMGGLMNIQEKSRRLAQKAGEEGQDDGGEDRGDEEDATAIQIPGRKEQRAKTSYQSKRRVRIKRGPDTAASSLSRTMEISKRNTFLSISNYDQSQAPEQPGSAKSGGGLGSQVRSPVLSGLKSRKKKLRNGSQVQIDSQLKQKFAQKLSENRENYRNQQMDVQRIAQKLAASYVEINSRRPGTQQTPANAMSRRPGGGDVGQFSTNSQQTQATFSPKQKGPQLLIDKYGLQNHSSTLDASFRQQQKDGGTIPGANHLNEESTQHLSQQDSNAFKFGRDQSFASHDFRQGDGHQSSNAFFSKRKSNDLQSKRVSLTPVAASQFGGQDGVITRISQQLDQWQNSGYMRDNYFAAQTQRDDGKVGESITPMRKVGSEAADHVQDVLLRIGATNKPVKEPRDSRTEIGKKLEVINQKQEQSLERLEFISSIRMEQQAEKEMMIELMSGKGNEEVRNRERMLADRAEYADKDAYFIQKLKEFKHVQKYQMGQDFDNLLSEDVIEKMAEERNANSLKLALQWGGVKQKHIWQPSKFTMTKYGPKIKFSDFS